MRTSLYVLLAASYLSAASPIGTPTVSPATISASSPNSVTTTIKIADAALVNGSVNLLRVDANGKSPSIVGVMHDDGINGDAVAGDGIFTLQVSFNQAAVGTTYLQVSAAFKGSLQRSLSAITPLEIR